MAFNIPLPPGLAGASPQTLSGAGNILEGYMQQSGDMRYASKEEKDFYADMAAIYYPYDYSNRALEAQVRENDQRLEYDYWDATQSAESAERQAQISAGAYADAAAVGAEADMYAADQSLKAAQEAAAASRYAADQALQGIRETNETKLKIAAAQLSLEAKRIAAEEMGAPSDWRTQAGYLRSQGMTQADITPGAIQQAGQALGPVAPEMAPQATGAPVGAPAPSAAPTLPSPQQAIVGEQGPELATATPQGTQVQPLQPEQAWWLRKSGTPGMAGGGTVGTGRSAWRGMQGPSPTMYYRGGQHVPGGFSGTAGRTGIPGQSNTGTFQGAAAPNVGAGAPAPGGMTGARTGQPVGTGQPLAGGDAGGSATPVEPTPGQTTGEPPYIDMLRQGSYVPLWEAWQGPRTKPEVGMDQPISMPHEINYGNFVRLSPTEQQMAFADWEALGMAPDTALRIMQAAAMRGTARAGVGYG